MHPEKRYPRTGDRETVYLKQVITNPNIRVGDFTMYHDFIHDPRQFEQNAVRYHYPLNHDKLIIGKFCSIACGVQFLFNSANHTKKSLSTYPFPLFFEEWGLDIRDVASAWDNKGDIVIGNDVWIGYEAILLAGITIGDGAVIGTRALVTKDVPPYTIVGGTPARVLRKRFSEDTISALLVGLANRAHSTVYSRDTIRAGPPPALCTSRIKMCRRTRCPAAPLLSCWLALTPAPLRLRRPPAVHSW